MKFEFKPKDYSLSFREYLRFLNQNAPGVVIYTKTIIYTFSICIFAFMTYEFSKLYTVFKDSFFYTIISYIVIILAILLIFILFIKISNRNKKKQLKNNIIYYDMESTIYFTIEDGYFIRENEFSTIKLQLNQIKYVKLLKYGLILSTDNEKITFFIPKDVLPITFQEFISLLKNENDSLIVIDEWKRLKKLYKKISNIIIFAVTLSFILSFLIGMNSFKKYNLIPNSNIIEQYDNTYIYENDTLGFSLIFPSKWEGKFGIEEGKDRVNVYYLANGKQSHDTTLLFSIRGLGVFFSDIHFNIIRNEGLYLFIGPSKIGLKKDSKEYLEYMELYKDIKNVKLRKNTYHQFKI